MFSLRNGGAQAFHKWYFDNLNTAGLDESLLSLHLPIIAYM